MSEKDIRIERANPDIEWRELEPGTEHRTGEFERRDYVDFSDCYLAPVSMYWSLWILVLVLILNLPRLITRR